MRKIFTSLALVAAPLLLQAQSGTLDLSFNGNGISVSNYTNQNNSADAMAIQADGKIVVAGATGTSTNAEMGVTRFNTDGSIDTTFGENGKVHISTSFIKSFVMDMTIQADGKIVLAGYQWNNTTGDFVMVRLNEDGSFDNSFGTNGIAIIDGGKTEVAESILPLENGKFLIGGYINDQFGIARVNSDGSLDTSFGADGWVETNVSVLSYGNTLSINSDGRILFTGSVIGTDNTWQVGVAAYDENGNIDSSFGDGGIKTFHFGTDNDFSASSIQLNDGKILIGGHSWYETQPLRYEIAIAKLNADGSFDTSYGTNGISKFRWVADNENYFTDMVLQNDGKLVVTGRTVTPVDLDLALARLNADGQLDSSFGTAGITITDIDLSVDTANNILLQTDGKIVVSGDTVPEGELTQIFAARYTNELMGTQDFTTTEVSLYPNPATQEINIEWSNTTKEYKVEIYNLTGQKLKTTQLQNKGKINVSSFAVGTYFMKLTADGKTSVVKFIKK